MEKLRKNHNEAKESLIKQVTTNGSVILDVGCGYGGDFHKWKRAGAIVYACDPNQESINEATQRMSKCNMTHVEDIWVGDIHSCEGQFDVICFNFSIHYAFSSENEWKCTVDGIYRCCPVGGFLIGTVFDSQKIISIQDYEDSLGNKISRDVNKTGYGKYGEYINVCLTDTPYFKGKYIPEPIAYKDYFVHEMVSHGFSLVQWKPLLDTPNGTISDLYSRFIFKRSK